MLTAILLTNTQMTSYDCVQDVVADDATATAAAAADACDDITDYLCSCMPIQYDAQQQFNTPATNSNHLLGELKRKFGNIIF